MSKCSCPRQRIKNRVGVVWPEIDKNIVSANAVLQRPSIIIENINDISESRSAATLLAEFTLLQKAGQFPPKNC
jgi:hypothetical protein